MFLFGGLVAYKLVWNRFAYLAISVFSIIFVGFFAPLEAVNTPLSTKRYRLNRIRSLVVVCINSVSALFFIAMNIVYEEANMYFTGIFFASASLIVGKIKNSLKGEKSYEI